MLKESGRYWVHGDVRDASYSRLYENSGNCHHIGDYIYEYYYTYLSTLLTDTLPRYLISSFTYGSRLHLGRLATTREEVVSQTRHYRRKEAFYVQPIAIPKPPCSRSVCIYWSQLHDNIFNINVILRPITDHISFFGLLSSI